MTDVLRLKPGDDLRMMQTPDAWPLGPVLCLTRRDELGLLILHPDIERKEVFLLNLHDPRLRGLLAGDKGSVNSIVYSSWEQLYDEGWRVD